MSDAKPVLLSRQLVVRALADQQFYKQLPEFSSLQPKLRTMGVISHKGGCRGCRERRVQQNLFGDFLIVTKGLDQNGIERLKRYLGAERLMYSSRSTTTGGYETKIV